jgi:hypothetical protein
VAFALLPAPAAPAPGSVAAMTPSPVALPQPTGPSVETNASREALPLPSASAAPSLGPVAVMTSSPAALPQQTVPPVETNVPGAVPPTSSMSAASSPGPVAVTTSSPAALPQPTVPPAGTDVRPAAPAVQTVHIDLPPADAASPEFKAFIENLHVNGVFQGENPRVLIGNSTYYVGDVINSDLGVVFIGIDPDRELALFKDSTGVTLVKKY